MRLYNNIDRMCTNYTFVWSTNTMSYKKLNIRSLYFFLMHITGNYYQF